MKYIRTITIDISKKIYETIETKSKDTARYLLFKILNNGVPLDLTGKTVRAYSSANKFNNLVVVSAKDGLCELKLTTGFLSDGLNQAELTIYEGLETLSNMPFYINNIVCLRNDAAIEATNDFSALTIALDKVEQLEKNLNIASTDLEKKYTARLNGIDAQLEDNALNSIETDASLTKLNSVVDGNLIVDRIQGRTLVNLTKFTSVGAGSSSYSVVVDKTIVKSRTVTIVNNTNKSIGIFVYDGEIPKPVVYTSEILYKIVLSATESIRLIGANFTSGWTEANKNDLLEVMILDGAVTTAPSYFEGMKSVAEDNQNKIEISSVGKNLWNPNTLDAYTTKENGENLIDYKAMTDNNVKILQGCFKTNTQYTLTYTYKETVGDKNPRFLINYTDGTSTDDNFRSTPNYTTVSLSSTLGKTISYIAVSYSASVGKWYVKDICIKEGTDTVYESYKQDKSEISLSSPLPEWDYIDKDGRHKKSGQKNLSEISNFRFSNDLGSTLRFQAEIPNVSSSDYPQAICSHFPKIIDYNLDLEHFYISNSSGKGSIFIFISKSKLATPDLAGFKTWLQQNPVTVVYETIEETIEPINESLILSSFKDGYFGMNAGTINPVVSISFPTNIGERVTGVEESTIYLRNRYYESLKVQLQLLAKNIELENNKQSKTDSTLSTTSKEITGAINENKAAIDILKTDKEEILVKEIGENDCYIKYKDGRIYQSGVVLCDTNNEIYINFKHPFTTKCLFANGTSIWQTGCEGTGATNLVTIPSTTTLTFVNPGNKRKLMWEAFGI